ncbi:hypothetical protein NMG60_11005384 [Bertholletia excelsa]
MIMLAARLSRTAAAAVRSTGKGFVSRKPLLISHTRPPAPLSPTPSLLRSFCTNNGTGANPVASQMINYALSHARSQKSDESYAQALLVLEQCLSTQSDDNSKGMVLLAMSTLFYDRGNLSEAIERLQKVQDLNPSAIVVRVAATEALVGLHLEMGQDDTASMLADLCSQFLDSVKIEIGVAYGLEALDARTKAIKGLVELVRGGVVSAEPFFQGALDDKYCAGNVALSCAEFLHVSKNFSMAKKLYEKLIQRISEKKGMDNHAHYLAACNMASEEVLLAATCALGQLETHLGNFSNAEDILTRALRIAEQTFGYRHPKTGVVLTCIGLMFRHKAMVEHSSSILIQEGLYRRAIDLAKAPPVESQDAESEDTKVYRYDILALARGGYAETLLLQQNRKAEGEKMKSWAESAWRNSRFSLAEALDISEPSSKVPVVDGRISRVL